MNWLSRKLMANQANPAPAGSPTLTVDVEGRRLVEAITAEIATKRAGDDSGWLSWSGGCRAKWAASVLALTSEWRLNIQPEDRTWLELMTGGS